MVKKLLTILTICLTAAALGAGMAYGAWQNYGGNGGNSVSIGEYGPMLDALIANDTLPDQFSNPSAMGAQTGDGYIDINSDGWGAANQVAVYNASRLKKTDVRAYKSLSMTVKNNAVQVLKMKLGTNGNTSYAFDVPADREWHTYTVTLEDFALTGTLASVYFQFDSSEPDGKVVGHVYLRDLILLKPVIPPTPSNALIGNGTVPDQFANPGLMSAQSNGEYIDIFSAGWGKNNQTAVFNAPVLNVTDVSAYSKLSVTVRNTTATVLKLNLGTNGSVYACTVPADSEWHTYTILLSDIGLTGTLANVTLQFDSDEANGAVAGNVHFKDFLLSAETE